MKQVLDLFLLCNFLSRCVLNNLNFVAERYNSAVNSYRTSNKISTNKRRKGLDVVKVGSVNCVIFVVRVSGNFENLFPVIIISPLTFFLVNLVSKMI